MTEEEFEIVKMIIKDSEKFIKENCSNPTGYLILKKKWVKEIRIRTGESYLNDIEEED